MPPSTLISPPPRSRPARDRLLAAALELLASRPAVVLNLEDIRARAGVSVGALYHHFADKRALLDALFLELTEDVQGEFLTELRVHPGAEEGVKAIVRWYLRWVSAHRAEANVLLGERPVGPALEALNRQFFSEVLAWWRTHAHYGALRDLPPDVIHALWLGPAHEYTRHWVGGRVKRVPRSVSDALAEGAWAALRAPA